MEAKAVPVAGIANFGEASRYVELRFMRQGMQRRYVPRLWQIAKLRV